LAHVSDFPDDSADFAETERRFVREVVGVTDFEWVAFDHPSPRTPLAVPLSEATVTLVSTAGAHLTDERPLGAGGDAALLATDADVQLSHVGYDTDRAMEDLDVVYPVRTLRHLAAEGFIGALAPTVISTMGFVPDGRRLLDRAVPRAVERIHDEQAHLALLVPA
jgi:D-proline reductase (dithiol) PrdB